MIVPQRFKRPRGKHIRHNRPGYRMTRRPWLKNEKASIIILRRVGLSINQIATFLGRSTSGVCITLKTALKRPFTRGLRDPFGRALDLRKSPQKQRRRVASYLWARMVKLMEAWEQWILGEGDKPP